MEEEYTAEEALVAVRNLPFPLAENGDTVQQFGHWFIMENDQWEPHSSPE